MHEEAESISIPLNQMPVCNRSTTSASVIAIFTQTCIVYSIVSMAESMIEPKTWCSYFQRPNHDVTLTTIKVGIIMLHILDTILVHCILHIYGTILVHCLI